VKHGKKLFLILLLAALAIGVFPISAHAEARNYKIRIYAGNKGTIAGGNLFTDTKPYSKSANYPLPEITATEGYYVKGIKESGKDTLMTTYSSSRDQDYIVSYGIKGAEVRYVVRYLEYGTDTVLAEEQTFYADPGDKPVSSYIYIEDYQPYRRTTKTLVEDESQNVLYAYYTRIPAETAAAAGGGGGGGGGAAGGGAAAGGNAGNANANAGNANAGNANADNNANANTDNANANTNADNAGGAAATDNTAAQQQPAQQQSYAQLEDIMDLDVPLASFEDIVGSTGSSANPGSSEPSIESGTPAVIEENTKPKGMSKGLLIFFVILFFCLIALLYWYLLFYRKKKKYADVEVVTFADDKEEDDDFDIEEFRRRHRKKDE
jgi:cbb3-type cytochrome oxidase subunit 3